MKNSTVISLHDDNLPPAQLQRILESRLTTIAGKLQAALDRLELNAEQLAGQIFEVDMLFSAASIEPPLGFAEQSARLDTMISDVISELNAIRETCK